jgi:hypothetical protein
VRARFRGTVEASIAFLHFSLDLTRCGRKGIAAPH